MSNQYKFDENGVCEIPELELHYKFSAIDPERTSKYGAWPYCISYQVAGLDHFGLGHYGSNYRLESADNANAVLNELILKHAPESKRAIEISRLGSREYSVGHKYKIQFLRPGLFHKGTYFENFRDIETYIARANEGKHKDANALEVRVFMTDSKGTYLGKYVWDGYVFNYEERGDK